MSNPREHATGKPNPNYIRRKLPVRKVDVSTVPAAFHADAVTRTGRTVWAAFSGERVICIGATADECRRSYLAWELKQPLAERMRILREMPQNLDA